MKNLYDHIKKLSARFGEDLIAAAYLEENIFSIAFEYTVSDIAPGGKDYYMRLEELQKAIKKFCENSTRYKMSTTFCNYPATVYYDFYRR